MHGRVERCQDGEVAGLVVVVVLTVSRGRGRQERGKFGVVEQKGGEDVDAPG